MADTAEVRQNPSPAQAVSGKVQRRGCRTAGPPPAWSGRNFAVGTTVRIRPQQWGTKGNWLVYPGLSGEPWYGFGAVRQLEGLPPEILLVPLPGHTHGHAGVAVRKDNGWLLQTGDAYFHHREMDHERPYCTPGLSMYQAMLEKDRRARLDNQQRLRELRRRHGHEVRVFCAHDPLEYEQLSGRTMGTPVLPRRVATPA